MDKCNINYNLDENISFLNRSTLYLDRAVDRLIKIDCSNLEIENSERFNTLLTNKGSLENLVDELKNLKHKKIQNKEEELKKLYEEYSRIRNELTKKIDPLTIDLVISADEIARNDMYLPEEQSCLYYFYNKIKNRH